MRRTLTLLLAVIVVMITLSPIGVFAKTFPDVPNRHPNYDAVVKLTEMGVISGYEDGSFQPGREITRTEFCALMARTLGCDKETYKVKNVPFSDVKKSYWGISFISFCYEKGLINGMGDGTFAPADKVTMAQAVKMAVCALDKEDEALSIGGKNWYSGYVEVAEKYGLLRKVDQTPDENAKRVNVAQIVYNMVEFEDEDKFNEEEVSDPSDDDVKIDEEEEEIDSEKDENSDDDDKKEDEEDESPLGPLTPAESPSFNLKPNNIPGITFTEEEEAEIDAAFAKKDYSQVKVIVIDPGHNYSGADIGARIDALDVREEIITWQIADRVREKLEAMGYTVYMTRDKVNDNIANSSTGASLQARVDFAHKKLADLYISIHCNMGGGNGTETYCFSNGGYSARLAKLIQSKIVKNTGLTNRGVKNAKFFVIKNTAMPSVLVETGFLDNAGDRKLLMSEEGQDVISQAIADAVKEYDGMAPIKAVVKEAPAEEKTTESEKTTENADEDVPVAEDISTEETVGTKDGKKK